MKYLKYFSFILYFCIFMVFFEKKKGEIGHHIKYPFETDSVHVDPETQELYGKITICNVTKIVFFFF